MSAFIGPIHYWLYNKIRLVNDRQDFLAEKVADRLLHLRHAGERG